MMVISLNLTNERLYKALDTEWPSLHNNPLDLSTLTNHQTLPPDIYSHTSISTSTYIAMKMTDGTFAEIFDYWYR
jgi:hypothetical protein